jgi:PelA/Pel-15E family pectate lyase
LRLDISVLAGHNLTLPSRQSQSGDSTVFQHRFAIAGLLLAVLCTPAAAADNFPWQRYQAYPDDWYQGFEAKKIAANVISNQSPLGGWPKNIDTGLKEFKDDPKSIRPTMEAGATLGELRFLARWIHVTNDQRSRPAFDLGLKYILDAQYPNGGWPVAFPQPKGYLRFITFNDGHMLSVMEFLRDVCQEKGFAFVRRDKRELARKAIDRGIECIVKCQIVVDGEPTAWCARHDERTLEPRPGRRVEPVAFSTVESAANLMLLMSLENPNRATARAIHAGCAWFETAQLARLRLEKTNDDVVVVQDLDAPPLWGRMYDIGNNRPIFIKRDGSVMHKLADIEVERRNEMPWYGTWGEVVLRRYAEWKGQ